MVWHSLCMQGMLTEMTVSREKITNPCILEVPCMLRANDRESERQRLLKVSLVVSVWSSPFVSSVAHFHYASRYPSWKGNH